MTCKTCGKETVVTVCGDCLSCHENEKARRFFNNLLADVAKNIRRPGIPAGAKESPLVAEAQKIIDERGR